MWYNSNKENERSGKMENFVYEYPTKVFFGNHGQGLAVVHPVYYKHIYKDGLSKFARFVVNVWGISPKGKSEEEIALAGIDALADFIKECGLPTHLTELKTKAKITEDMLKAVADSTNIIQTGYGVLTHEEIYNILKECI